jgi:hypothetical protein
MKLERYGAGVLRLVRQVSDPPPGLTP